MAAADSSELNERGRRLADEGDDAGAADAYRAAAAADDTWSVPWYNLALLHKYRGEWAECARHGREAVARDPSDGGAWWNLGIAATALGRWAEARRAWRRCGIDVPDGEGPPDMHMGLTPVRLNPQGQGEVVWCHRIDPARAIVSNVPFPESGYRYGDLVLHDGAANGTRMLHGVEVPVFDALERLTASDLLTWILDVPDSTVEARAALADVADELGGAAEDWSTSVRFLCRSCSEGRPHEHHDTELSAERPELAVAVAARSAEEVEAIVARWRGVTGHRGWVGLSLAEGGEEW